MDCVIQLSQLEILPLCLCEDSPELGEIVTLKDVVVANDLQVAKVCISLYRIGADDDDEPSYDTWDRRVMLRP